jgi:hypothetical protein
MLPFIYIYFFSWYISIFSHSSPPPMVQSLDLSHRINGMNVVTIGGVSNNDSHGEQSVA